MHDTMLVIIRAIFPWFFLFDSFFAGGLTR